MSQHTLTVNGGPTVVYTLTGGRQGPPGPDLVADRAAIEAAAAAAAADALATAADRVQTGLDAVATAADRVQTGTDRTTATAQAAAASASASTATAQANLAASSAASASSVAQQDLSGVTAAALHRSPNAVVAMCVYDTSKDSDGGAWVERCTQRSWYNESLNGTWRGACASEAACRAISGATTGDFFQLTTDGKFYKLNAGSGTTEVFRGNKAKFPRLAAIVAEAASVTIYDLTEPGRPMWMRFVATSLRMVTTSTVSGVSMTHGVLSVGNSAGTGGVALINFPADNGVRLRNSTQGFYGSGNGRWGAGISKRNDLNAWDGAFNLVAFQLPSDTVNAVAMTVMPDAPVDPVTGLQVPTIAVATAGGISIIRHDGTVRNSSSTSSFGHISINKDLLVGGSSSSSTLQYATRPGSLGASFGLTSITASAAPGFSTAAIPASWLIGRSTVVRRTGAQLALMRLSEASASASLVALIADTYATGWWCGDIRRVWCADTVAGTVSNPSTEADRCYKNKPLTVYGTLTKATVASAAQLVAYSGWSASNYGQEPYSADLDPALAAVTCSAWVTYTTAVASTIVERAAASGARIVLGTDGTGKLTATAYDGTTTRTVTTAASYNTTTWLKARASYTTDGTLSISVNGRIVASTYGAPLLTLSNASAVATIGNDRTLATPFPGSIALVKWGATVPSQEAMLWMYEQEKQMFRDGAQVTLPSSNSLLDVAYDDLYNRITVVDSGNESNFEGLVRVSTATVPAGAYTKAARGSGVKLLARSTTNIGVDITIPSQNLKEELKRTEDAARRARLPMTFDYVGGFTGNTTNGSTAIASVAGLSVPSTANLRGVTVTGTGIPASTVITDIVGSTVYISKAATATNTGVSISMLEFPLPTGYEAEGVATAGALKQEGATKDWTRSYDGFVERPTFPSVSPPGPTTWVQVRARRTA